MISLRVAHFTLASIASLLLVSSALGQGETVTLITSGANLSGFYHNADCALVKTGSGLVTISKTEAESRGFRQHADCEPKVYIGMGATTYHHRADCPALVDPKPIPVRLAELSRVYTECPRCRLSVTTTSGSSPTAAATTSSASAQTPVRTLAAPTTAPTRTSGPVADGQCHGITQKGVRCKRHVRAGALYCYQHGG